MLQRFRDYLLAEDDDWPWLANQGAVPGKPGKTSNTLSKACGTWPRSRIVRPKFTRSTFVKTASQAIGPVKYPRWSNTGF